MIIIDLNSIGFAATAANPGLSSGSQLTGGVFGMLRTLRTIREEYPGKMIGLWDGKSWRKDVFPEYKANRATNEKLVAVKEQWVSQRQFVVSALKSMGIDQLSAANMEADDLAAMLVGSRSGSKILITGDKDWMQLVSPDTIWVDPIRDRRCTVLNFKEMTDCDNPWQFIQVKALAGDRGDNIPPTGGVGPGAARWIFHNSGGVMELFNDGITAASNTWPKKIQEFVDSEEKRENFKRNLLLVWLRHPNVPSAAQPNLIKGKLDVEAFTRLAEELNFSSILRDADSWLQPFSKELTQEGAIHE